MSVTSKLKGKNPDRVFIEIVKETLPKKECFKTVDGRSPFLKQELLVPYKFTVSYNSSVSGTAFDFLARLLIARKVGINNQASNENTGARETIKKYNTMRSSSLVFAKIIERYKSSLQTINNFIRGLDVNIDDIIEISAFIARLEHVFRSNIDPKNIEQTFLGKENSEVLDDLKLLIKLFENVFLNTIVKPDSDVVFNPTFGVVSVMAQGADADVFIDGVLYDFKISKKTGYYWEELGQIYCYFLFNRLQQKFPSENPDLQGSLGSRDITRLAFYRGRTGVIEYVEISDLDEREILKTEIKVQKHLGL